MGPACLPDQVASIEAPLRRARPGGEIPPGHPAARRRPIRFRRLRPAVRRLSQALF